MQRVQVTPSIVVFWQGNGYYTPRYMLSHAAMSWSENNGFCSTWIEYHKSIAADTIKKYFNTPNEAGEMK